MANVFIERFETGTNGTAITGANTAYTGGVGVGSATVAFDNTQAAAGTLSAKIAQTANFGSVQLISPAFAATNTRYRRWAFRLGALPPGNLYIGAVYTASNATIVGRVGMTSGGLIFVQDASTTVATGTVALSANTWYRIEWDLVGTSSVVRIYLAASTTIVDTISGTVAGNTFTSHQTGIIAASGAGLTTMFVDEEQTDSTATPGAIFRIAPASLAGAAALTATPRVAFPTPSSMAGVATVAAAAAVAIPAASSMTGAAALTATAGQSTGSSASGAATVTAAAKVISVGPASLTGAATVTAAASVIVPGASSLTGAATLTATASSSGSSTASLTGAAALTAGAKVISVGPASLTGAATASAAAKVISVGPATATGAAALAAGGSVLVPGASSLSGAATATATASVLVPGATSSMSGAASLSATSKLISVGSSTMAGASTFGAVGRGLVIAAPTALSGSPAMSAVARQTVVASATMSGVAALTAVSATPSLTGRFTAFGETVVIRRAEVGAVDGFGDSAPGAYVDHLICYGCAVWPTGSSENDIGRTEVATTLQVVLPAGADAGPYDRLRWRGDDYEIVGRPFDWESPLSGWRPGLELTVKEVSG